MNKQNSQRNPLEACARVLLNPDSTPHIRDEAFEVLKRHGAQGVAYVLALFAGSPDFQPLKAASEGVILASEWSYPDTPFIATGRAWDDFSTIASRLVWEVGVASVPPIKEFLSRPECSKSRGVISFLAIFQDVTALEYAVLRLKECIASNPVPKNRWRRYWAEGGLSSLDFGAWDALQILQYFSQQALEANGARSTVGRIRMFQTTLSSLVTYDASYLG